MRVRKIPKRCLIHSVRLAEVTTESGAFGGINVTEGAEIRNVRVVNPRTSITVSGINEERSVDAIIIHQPGISTDCTFTVGGYIIFGGQLYEIVEVTGCDELERYHHTEVKLSRVDCN
ncbi:MAG: putative minor capsid protein [Ruminiclostridium sp.]